MNEQVRKDMACLITSPYRGQLLLELRDSNAGRTELKTAVGASQATVSRSLAAFEERGWVSRVGRTHHLTQLGRLVAETFEVLEAAMTTAHELRGIIEHIPLDEMGFDISQLRGATVVRPTQADPLAPIRHAKEFLDGAETVTMLSHAFSPGAIEIIHQRAQMGQSTTVIVTTEVVETLTADETFRTQVREAVADEMLELWEYDEEIPHILAIADEMVSFGVDDENGHVIAVIDAGNERVYQWAEETIEQYRSEATRVKSDCFVQGPGETNGSVRFE